MLLIRSWQLIIITFGVTEVRNHILLFIIARIKVISIH